MPVNGLKVLVVAVAAESEDGVPDRSVGDIFPVERPIPISGRLLSFSGLQLRILYVREMTRIAALLPKCLLIHMNEVSMPGKKGRSVVCLRHVSDTSIAGASVTHKPRHFDYGHTENRHTGSD